MFSFVPDLGLMQSDKNTVQQLKQQDNFLSWRKNSAHLQGNGENFTVSFRWVIYYLYSEAMQYYI